MILVVILKIGILVNVDTLSMLKKSTFPFFFFIISMLKKFYTHVLPHLLVHNIAIFMYRIIHFT